MKTRDLMLAGAGVVVGYLLVAYWKKNKPNTQQTEGVKIAPTKNDKCKAELALQMQSAKFSTVEAKEAFMKEVFDACMAKS